MVGGGNTAISDALYLSTICKKVYLVHRRDKFRAENGLLKQLKKTENIEMLLGYIPKVLEGNNILSGIYLQKNQTNKNEEGLFVAGDCRSKKIRQLTTAVGDGTTCALLALEYLEACFL